MKTPEIRAKLIVLISSIHDNSSSFIKLGALRYFEEGSGSDPEISPFHWDFVDSGVSVQDYVLDDIVKELAGSLRRVRPKGRFKISSLGDRIYLTLTICHLLRGARLPEIKDCYEALGLIDFEKEIIKHLSVLEICKFIVPVSHGKKVKYFVPLIGSIPIRVAFNAGVEDRDRDTLRWINEISAQIVAEEPARMRIFQEHQNVG